jgi:hypothetical protein
MAGQIFSVYPRPAAVIGKFSMINPIISELTASQSLLSV